MLTFYQYLETITHDKFDKASNDRSKQLYLRSILSRLDHKTIVKFALFCVKDVQHLSNDTSIFNVINLIERWLKNNRSVSNQEMLAASNDATNAAGVVAADEDADNFGVAAATAYAASYATDAAYVASVRTATITAATNAASNAASASAGAAAATSHAASADAAYVAEYNDKMDRYIQVAKSLTSKSNVKDQKIHVFIQELEQYINDPKEFKVTLGVLFDYLDEMHQEQIIQSIGNKMRLNLPTGYDITSEDDLVQVIAGDNSLRRQVLFYLKNLYK